MRLCTLATIPWRTTSSPCAPEGGELSLNMPPKAKFLTAVWGKAYIDRFCLLSLPSFLAPGNLPALAQALELEVVIMTRQRDFEHFQRNPTFRRLCTICPVRFVEIDDL